MHQPVNRTLSIVVDMRESPNVVHVNRTLSSVDMREIPTVVLWNSCYIKWSICAQFQLYVSVAYTCILMLYDPPGMEVSLGNQCLVLYSRTKGVPKVLLLHLHLAKVMHQACIKAHT